MGMLALTTRRFIRKPMQVSSDPINVFRLASLLPIVILVAPLCTIGYAIAVTPASGWDSLTYHLEFPAQWQARDGIDRPQTAFGDLSPPYYPALAQHVLLLFQFTGNTAIARLAHAFWLGFAGLSIFAILREADRGASRGQVANYALLCVSFPAVSTMVITADNDVALAALLLAAQAAFLRFLRSGSALSAGACMLCLALGAATKYVGLVYVAGLLLVQLCAVGLRRDRRKGYAIALPLFAVGCPIYIMNWLEAGNPLYPGRWSFSDSRSFLVGILLSFEQPIHSPRFRSDPS